MREWQKKWVFDKETWAIFDSLEKEDWGRPTALADLDRLAAQISGVEMHRLCAEARRIDLLFKAADQFNFLGFMPGDGRNILKQQFAVIDKFGLGFDDKPKSGKGFQFWIHSPLRFKRWMDGAAVTAINGGPQFALSSDAFNRLTRDGVDLEKLAHHISGAKVLRLFHAVRDLEYTRTLRGRYWKWMMGDLYPADQAAELKSLCGLKLNRWRKQIGETIVFDVVDPDRLRAWIERDA
jgi:hypothetical protein